MVARTKRAKESGREMTVFFPFSIGYFLLFISWIPSCDGMTEEVAFVVFPGFHYLIVFPTTISFCLCFFCSILFHENLSAGKRIYSGKVR
jgi:apolipoprotein N-acyltransferase